MLSLIFGFFGYVKVPACAIELSKENEVFLQAAVNVEKDARLKVHWARMLMVQQSLTGFLRSGRVLATLRA